MFAVAVLFFFPFKKTFTNQRRNPLKYAVGTSAHSLCITLPTASDRAAVFPPQPSAAWILHQLDGEECAAQRRAAAGARDERGDALWGLGDSAAYPQHRCPKAGSACGVTGLGHITSLFLTQPADTNQAGSKKVGRGWLILQAFGLTFLVSHLLQRQTLFKPGWHFT